MPIPTPNTGESRDQFMGRCVSFLVDEGKPQDQAVAICAGRWGKKSMHPMPQNETQKVRYWKRFDQQRWGYLSWAQSKFLNALKKQAQPVLELMEFDLSEAIRAIDTMRSKPIEDAMLTVYGKVGAQFALQVYDSFKAYHPATVRKQVEESMFMDFIRQWVQLNAAFRIQAITETTRSRIKAFLQQAIDEGLGIDEAARLLDEQSHIIGITRARMIARTEIISASNRGSLEGARRTNLNLNKEWISTRDDRTRTFADGDRFDHFQADGQVVNLEEPFVIQGTRGDERLMFPGDPSGSAANTIMCRCTQGYKRKQ